MSSARENCPRLHVEYVRIRCDYEAGRVIELSSPRFVIGRAANSNLHIDDRRLSRQHAEIICEAERYFLVDLGSRNGTRVNGKPLVEGERQPLKDQDEIQIGPLLALRFEDPTSTVGASADVILSRGLGFDASRREIYVRHQKLDPPLTAQQFKLLELLFAHQGDLVTKDEVIGHIWPMAKGGVTDQMLDNLVARLRQRLGQFDDEHDYIVRIRGVGLKFVQRE